MERIQKTQTWIVSLDAQGRKQYWLMSLAGDSSDTKNFLKHYLEEIKDQFRGGSTPKK